MTHSRIAFRLAAVAALVAGTVLHAQAATPASAPAAAAAPAPAAIDPEKQKLITQILAVWHPENAVISMLQRPAVDAIEKSRIALQQNKLPPEKLDATMKDITGDVQKYVDTASPPVAASARKSLPTTAVPMLAQNFTVDELRQLLALLQSPVRGKFEKLIPQIDQAIGKKVQDEVGADVNKQIQTLNESVGTKLRVAITANKQ